MLGYGGLVPFVFAAAVALGGGRYAQWSQEALSLYGGIILSFVGALHWAFAMTSSSLSPRQRNMCYLWSVVPALIAWMALLAGPPAGNILLGAGFVLHYWRDRALVVAAGLPAWYLPLRLRLTVIACLCLAAGGAAVPTRSVADARKSDCLRQFAVCAPHQPSTRMT